MPIDPEFTRHAKWGKWRILADSANAKHRFGFAGAPMSPVTQNLPKPSDLWFMEFTTVTDGSKNNLEQIGVLANAVSPISIQTSSMPVDQYGKRVYIPTRVDFPEVALTMYDDISGKMFDLCSGIYSKFFKNNEQEVTGANAEQTLTGVGNHGRKFPEGKHDYYHQNFEKITIYHFFGNLESAPANLSHLSENHGKGTLQKIELINPLVTSMQFSGSDYSATELRTVDLSLQPENVIIGKVEEDISFPDWMTWGMHYMMNTLTPMSQTTKFDPYPAKGDPAQYLLDNNKQSSLETAEGREKHIKAQLESDELMKEMADEADTMNKISELATLYNAKIKDGEKYSDGKLEKALADRIGVINAAQANRFTKEPQKSYIDDFNARDESTFSNTYKNPDIPSFGEIGSSNPPRNQYPKINDFNTNLNDSLVQELVGSFFGQRDFNVNNIFNLKQQLKNAANSIQSGIGGAISNGLNIDGQSLYDGVMQPPKRPPMETVITEKAYSAYQLEDNAVILNTGNHTGVSKMIKTYNGQGPE